MKAFLPLVEKYLGPKASAAVTAGATAYGQLQSALISAPEGVTRLDLVMHALQDGNLTALLPAPLVGIATLVMRSANPEKPVDPMVAPPVARDPETLKQINADLSELFKGQSELDARSNLLEGKVDSVTARQEKLENRAQDIIAKMTGLEEVVDEAAQLDNTNLPLNLRQNNPGNIESTVPGGNRWKGEQDSTNRYAVFETPAHGVRAMLYLLRKVYFVRHRLSTVYDIIHRWAPLGDNSPESVSNYIKSVSDDLRVEPHAQLALSTDDDQLVAMLKSMAEFEGGRPLPYNKSVYTKALELLK